MAIKLDIQTTGVSTLERAAAAFDKMSGSTGKVAVAYDKLTGAEKKLVAYFKQTATQMGKTSAEFRKFKGEVDDTTVAMSSMAFTKQPFSVLAQQIKHAKAGTAAFRAEMGLLNADMQKLSSSKFERLSIVQDKASLILLKDINAETEKQAIIRAKIATIKGNTEFNTTLKETATNLRLAKTETEKLAAAYTKLGAAEKKVATNPGRLGVPSTGNALSTSGKGQTSVIGMLGGTTTKTTAEVNKLGIAETKTAAATNKATAAAAKQVEVNKTLQGAIRGTAGALGGLWLSYGNILPMMAAFAAASMVKSVYDLGAAFEYTTTYVDALNDAVGGLDAGQIQEQLLGLEGLRKTPTEMADGMKEFAKAGVEASEAIGQVAEMSKFATLAEMGMGEATKMIIGQSNAFGTTFANSANMIAAAALSSATDIGELGNALSYTTELATISKVQFDEVATALALMANAGIRGSKAGTAIRTSILKMQAPTSTFKKELDALGISWTAFTDGGQVKSLRVMFTELKKATENLPDAKRVKILKELFGLRSLKGGANILKSMGKEWDDMNAKIRASTEGVSFVSQKYEEVADTVTARWERLGNEMQKAILGAFDGDAVSGMLDSLTGTITSADFQQSLKSTVDLINSVGKEILALVEMTSTLPGDWMDKGLVGVMLFGKGVAPQIAAATAFLKIARQIADESRSDKKDGELGFWASMSRGLETYLQDLIKAQNFSTQLGKTLKLTPHNLPQAEIEANKNLEQPDELVRDWQREQGLPSIVAGVKIKFEVPSMTSEIALLKAELERALNSGQDSEALKVSIKIQTVVEAGLLDKELERLKALASATTPTKTIQLDTAALISANEIKKLKEAGDYTKDYEEKIKAVRNEARKYAMEQGEWNEATQTFTKLGQEHYDALLESKGLYVSETAKEIEATRALGLEMEKAFEGEFGLGSMDGGASAFLSDFEEGIHTTLPLIDEWDKKLRGIDDKVIAFANKKLTAGIEFDSEDLEEYREKLIWLAEYKGLQQIAKDSEALDFKIMINGMREAKDGMNKFDVSANNVKATYAELKEAAYKYLSAKGQVEKDTDGNWKFNSEAGATYFQKLTQEANIFGKAIKAAEKEIRAMKDEFSDTSFDLDLRTAKVRLGGVDGLTSQTDQYRLAVKEANHYRIEAQKAIDGTDEGLARSTAMWKKAYATTESFDTDTRAQYDAKVADLEYAAGQIRKNLATAGENAIDAKGGLEDGKAKNDAYIQKIVASFGKVDAAIKSHGTILTADGKEMATWANGQITAIDSVINKWRELSNTSFTTPEGVSITFPEGTPAETVQAAKDYGTTLGDNKGKVVELADETIKQLGRSNSAWAEASGAMEVKEGTTEGGKNVASFGGKIYKWSETAVSDIGKVKGAWEELAKTINNMPTPKTTSSSDYEGARALGGPVSAGSTYMVGEVGPELFTPRTGGVIIPNNKLSGSSEKMVDINFNMGGQSVPLKGTETSIKEIYRQTEERKRYAA